MYDWTSESNILRYRVYWIATRVGGKHNIIRTVLTVSPKSWKRARSPLNTPAVTGPEFNPTLKPSIVVSGPSLTSSSRVKTLMRTNACLAKRICYGRQYDVLGRLEKRNS